MRNNTLRFTRLRGEYRRQMNGAVASAMRYYGAPYSLNYGVSLSTIRQIAASEGKDHDFAKYLFEQQQIREVRLASLHIAQVEMVTVDEFDFWMRGITNSEIAEEGAFALFQYVDGIEAWLESDEELVLYSAILSIAKSRRVSLTDVKSQLLKVLERGTMLLTSAVVILLESYNRDESLYPQVDDIVESLAEGQTTAHIKSELEWRCERYTTA